MKRLIHNTLTTLTETFLVLVLILGISYYLGYRQFDRVTFFLLYVTLLSILFVLKKLKLQWRRYYIQRFSLRKIDRMNGIDFEQYLKVRFESLGFRVETTKASGDYGADLILQKKKYTIAVQAKRYQGKIGVKAIQEVIGSMAYYQADKGLVVTNSYYTPNAQELADANDIILWDRDVLTRMIAKENMSAYIAELFE